MLPTFEFYSKVVKNRNTIGILAKKVVYLQQIT